jgi:hypothetical protein
VTFWVGVACSLFTLLFSACFLKEKVTILKLLGVAVTCVFQHSSLGSGLFNDSNLVLLCFVCATASAGRCVSPSTTIIPARITCTVTQSVCSQLSCEPRVLCRLRPCFFSLPLCFPRRRYGVYTTAIRWYIPDESSVKMAYFFGESCGSF